MKLFKTKLEAATIVLIPACIGINYLGKLFASFLKLPLWLDSIGTCIGGCLGGPVIGAVCGAANNLIYGFTAGDNITLIYALTSLGIGLAAGAHMYVVAGAATLLTLFGLEVLTLFFGGIGRRRTMIVFSAAERRKIEEAFRQLEGRDYAIVSYEVETDRTPEGVVYRATLVIRAKGAASEEGFVELLRADPDITVERIV